jgi:acetate---CoA ligase (ADP-forming)
LTKQATSPGEASRLHGSDLVSLLVRARSVAIVGVDRSLEFLSRHGYAGAVTVVGGQHDGDREIRHLPLVADIPRGSVDVALVEVPPADTAPVLEELDRVGVRAAIVMSRELGPNLRGRIAALCEARAMRIIGPNSSGLVSQRAGAYLTSYPVVGLRELRRGGIAVVSQSGGLGYSVVLSLIERGGGVACWISTGDELDVGTLELVSGLLRRDEVAGVGVFLEAIDDLAYLDAVHDAISSMRKPVYLVKAGRSDAGREAAIGHTGRLVGSADVSLAVLRETGIVVVPTIAELVDAALALDLIGTLPGHRVGIVTISGGAGVLAADAVRTSRRLELAELAADPVLRAEVGGRVTHVSNPLDVAGSGTFGLRRVGAVGRITAGLRRRGRTRVSTVARRVSASAGARACTARPRTGSDGAVQRGRANGRGGPVRARRCRYSGHPELRAGHRGA